MRSQFSIFDLLLIIGIAQGVITSVLLGLTKKNAASNKFLAGSIISFCLLTVKMLLHSLELREDPFLRYFPLGIELLIAPLVYFYIISLITPEFKLNWSDSVHFAPFILSQGYSLFVFFLVLGDSTIAEKDAIAQSLHFILIKKVEDHLALLSIVGYLIVGFFKLRDYRNLLNNARSKNAYPNFNWLKNIFLLSLVLGFFLLINLSVEAFFNLSETHEFHWQAYYIFIASLIYYLGFAGYMQPHYQFEMVLNPATGEKLSEDKTTAIVEALEKALKVDKVFLKSTLSTKGLAKLLGVSQSNMSYVVNHFYKKNFRDLINDYRIEEVKSKLNDANIKRLSILGIALECGFNSEASFYRVFKKNTGFSPHEYIQQVNNARLN